MHSLIERPRKRILRLSIIVADDRRSRRKKTRISSSDSRTASCLAVTRVSHRWRVVSSLWACPECHYSERSGATKRDFLQPIVTITIIANQETIMPLLGNDCCGGNNDGDDDEEGRDRDQEMKP
ncbi:hypothetical protein X777_11477 [Ooceraea biroi]|uniref:Uncharacterized protein n=1 Tax=Ooceraea biroi TaxID=2015173 RepID=A0A026W4L8_OOCBI|nr:hypothetical protein X777_11477 [Ooceraea biroi]